MRQSHAASAAISVLSSVAAAIAGLAAASAASAQSQPTPNEVVPANKASPSPAAQASEEKSEPLQIVVTATKRSKLLRDVPISMLAITGEELMSANLTQVADLVTRVPALTLSTASNSPFAQIRGLGTGNNPSFDQAVGKFMDNVSYGRDQDLRLPLFDLERVEVLKGPQVLLYGNSTTAGALNITSRKPGKQREGDVLLSYDFKHRDWIAQGGVTVPISPTLSLRASALTQDTQKGDVFNTLTGDYVPANRNNAGRLILAFRPNAETELMFKVEGDRLRSSGAASELYVPAGFGPFPFADTAIDGKTAVNNNVAPFFQPSFNALDNNTYQLDANLDALGGRITSTTAWRTSQYAGSTPAYHPFPVANAFISNNYDQFSQELRYAGRAGALEVTLGAFIQQESLDAVQAIDFNVGPLLQAPIPPFAANFLLSQKTKSLSVFSNFGYALSEAVNLEAGARWTRVTRDASQSASAGNVVPDKKLGMGNAATSPNPALDPVFGFFFNTPPHFFTGLRYGDTFFQPQLVAQYKPSKYAQIYAKYVKGYKAGGFDSNYPGAPTGNKPAEAKFKAEGASSFELGTKGLDRERGFSYSITAFNTTFSNLQTNAFVAQATVSLVTNVGKARSRGVEMEFAWRPVPELQVNATATLADSKYLDFPGAACTLAGPCIGGQQDLSGKPTVFSSKFTGTLGAQYEQSIGDFVVTSGATIVARSKYNPSTNGEPFLQQKAYAQLDASVGLKPADGNWTLTLFGRNLTNTRYLDFGESVPVTTGALAVYRSRGRQLGMQAGFNF